MIRICVRNSIKDFFLILSSFLLYSDFKKWLGKETSSLYRVIKFENFTLTKADKKQKILILNLYPTIRQLLMDNDLDLNYLIDNFNFTNSFFNALLLHKIKWFNPMPNSIL